MEIGATVYLIPSPNKFHEKAVEVHFQDTQLGWLSRACAEEYFSKLVSHCRLFSSGGVYARISRMAKSPREKYVYAEADVQINTPKPAGYWDKAPKLGDKGGIYKINEMSDVLRFGRHRGTRLEDVDASDASYVKWMVGQNIMPTTLYKRWLLEKGLDVDSPCTISRYGDPEEDDEESGY